MVSVVILLFAFGVTITVFRKIFAQVSIPAHRPGSLTHLIKHDVQKPSQPASC